MGIALGLGLLVVGWAVFTFNRLIRLRQLGDNAWSDIDVQLKRRHDLIPNVVCATMPGSPASIEVGMSGALRMRVAEFTDRMRTLPLR